MAAAAALVIVTMASLMPFRSATCTGYGNLSLKPCTKEVNGCDGSQHYIGKDEKMVTAVIYSRQKYPFCQYPIYCRC